MATRRENGEATPGAAADPPPPAPLSLRTLLRELLCAGGRAAKRRRVGLDVELPDASTFVAADARGLAELALELVDRALEAAPPLGQIAVHARCVGTSVLVFVRDWNPNPPGDLTRWRRRAACLGGRLGHLPLEPYGSVFWLALPRAVAGPAVLAP